MMLSKGSRVRITIDGTDWIDVRFASFFACDVDAPKILMILEHSL